MRITGSKSTISKTVKTFAVFRKPNEETPGVNPGDVEKPDEVKPNDRFVVGFTISDDAIIRD